MDKSGLGKAAFARKLNSAPSTLYNWLRGDSPIDIETIAMSTEIWGHFLRCLVVMERKGGVI